MGEPSGGWNLKAPWTDGWNAAIKSLSSAALRGTRNAKIQNYLGYAYRNSGNLPPAFRR
jgi:hypothetical protein